MKYKKITNREAVELFLAGSDKLRVKPPSYNVPMVPSEDIPARYFANDSNQEFYFEEAPKIMQYNTMIVNTASCGQIHLTAADFPQMLSRHGFTPGTKVRVTIEEVVE